MIFFLSSLFLLHKSKAISYTFEFVYTIPLTPFSSVADQDKDPWHSHCHWSCCQILFHFHTSLRPNANQIRGQCNLQAWIIIQAANYRWVFYHYLKVTYCGGLLRLSTCCQRQHQGRSYSSSKNNVLQLFFSELFLIASNSLNGIVIIDATFIARERLWTWLAVNSVKLIVCSVQSGITAVLLVSTCHRLVFVALIVLSRFSPTHWHMLSHAPSISKVVCTYWQVLDSPNSRALLPFFCTSCPHNAQMGFILPIQGLILPRIPSKPLFFTQP